MSETASALLGTEALTVLGRIMPASNQTFLCSLGPEGPRVVYKPVAGERPLWDFPVGTLAGREYAAWLVSEATDWSIVPPTVLREGPLGPGMVQLWVDVEEGVDPVDIVPAGQLPPGTLHVLDAVDAEDRPVALVHEDTVELRRMAVFDVLLNNTDRKGGHVLPVHGGRRMGVDHGVCFHTDDKLRTVLWGWAGLPLSPEETAVVARVIAEDALAEALGEHLVEEEVAAFRRRGERLLTEGAFPMPEPGWPSIPWPPF